MAGWLGSLLGKGKGGMFGKTKILVVEDDTTTAKILMSILEEKGAYQVTLAGNGKQALEMLKDVKPTLVITDIMMPVMDGMQLLKALRKAKATESLPVIMLTSKSGDKDMMKGYSVGADYYIPKPFTKVQLLKGVHMVLSAPKKTGQKTWKIT